MVWNRDGNRCVRKALLHHDMAVSLMYSQEPLAYEDSADLLPGEDTELSQQIPPVGSRALPHASVSEFHSERQLRKKVQSLREDYFEPLRSYRLDWQYPALG